MFNPMSWVPFREPLLRNWAVPVVATVMRVSVVGLFAVPARASIITTGDLYPGGALRQPDPWVGEGDLPVGNSINSTLNVGGCCCSDRYAWSQLDLTINHDS